MEVMFIMKTMHLRLGLILAVFALGMISLGAWAGQTSIYKTGFEPSEGYAASQMVGGQGGWESSDGAKVAAGAAQAGVQFVALEPNSSMSRTLYGTGNVWLAGYYKGAGTDAPPDYPREQPAACVLHFSSLNGIQALTKNDLGEEVWVPSTPDQAVFTSADSWAKIALHITYNAQDPALARWEVYVNGQRYLSDLKFRDPVTALNGFRNLSGSQSAFDSFEVLVSDGDADGDGFSDTGEGRLGTDPLDPTNTPRDQFDINRDGKISILDAVLLSRIVQGLVPAQGYITVDADGDGDVDQDDADTLYRWILGDPSYPFLPKAK